jgi:hypothetical protein
VNNAIYLLAGALLGGTINITVQLCMRHIDRRRERRLACRVLIGELAEIASAIINTDAAAYDPDPLHEAWRGHRAALTDLGAEDWQMLDDAVMVLVYPDHFPPARPGSNPLPGPVELALGILERHATLPRGLRHG